MGNRSMEDSSSPMATSKLSLIALMNSFLVYFELKKKASPESRHVKYIVFPDSLKLLKTNFTLNLYSFMLVIT